MTSDAIDAPVVFEYLGNELDLFQEAACWKSYFASHLRPYVSGNVLEVGAGIGATSRVLCDDHSDSWTMLEPDASLASRLAVSLLQSPLPIPHELRTGTTTDLGSQKFDCILYIDVIEHIELDAEELERAAKHLSPGGHLVILVPAHNWLYTSFDRAIGHFRRYTRRSLRAAVPSSLRCRKLVYLDSVGLLASLANRLWLKAAAPSRGQIHFWDRVLVRGSRWLDPLLWNFVGKTVVGAWQRPE
ncbi:MAG: class I SAM-dependent methyltransferase [Planctomycetes bacterium]|nr:class I SAM-dependent methyltransferase [Planctomycetota bacterium]